MRSCPGRKESFRVNILRHISWETQRVGWYLQALYQLQRGNYLAATYLLLKFRGGW